MVYLSAAMSVGPWGGWLRRGLDQYLAEAHSRSLLCYLHAAELGECDNERDRERGRGEE